MENKTNGKVWKTCFIVILLSLGILISMGIFHGTYKRKSQSKFLPPPIRPIDVLNEKQIVINEKISNKKMSQNEYLNWPPERPKLLLRSIVNEFESSVAQPNVPDVPAWPMPLPPNKSNNKFILYECAANMACGGWSNRLYGIVALYMMAILSDRSIAIWIKRPCDIKNYLEPRDILWNVTLPKEKWYKTSFSGINGDKVPLRRLRELERNLNSKDIAVARVNIAQLGYIPLFATVKYFRNKLLKKGFTERQLDFMTTLHFPLRFQIYDLLFKLKPYLQERKDNFFKTLENKPLICAHVRTGGGRTIPGDVARGRTYGTKQLWNFLREKLEFTKFKDAKVFLATDTDTVREEFKKEFGNRGTEISGNIVHVDRWGAQKNTFGGSKKAACEGTDKVMLDFEVMSECDLLVVTWRSGFSTMPALRNRHRNELYVWRCENNKCWVEPFYRFQDETRKDFQRNIRNQPYFKCKDIFNC